MTRAPRFAPLAAALLGAALCLSVPGARAAESVADTALGARIEDAVTAGDVDVWRVALLAGTELRVRLDAESPGKGGDDGPVPSVFVVAPDAEELGRAEAGSGELRLVAAAAGVHRVEVRAGTYTGGYELRIEGDAPAARPVDERREITLSGAPLTVHVDAPAGSSVEIDLRRRTGTAPEIVAIADGAGRPLDVVVRTRRASRLRLEDVPVPLAGGLDVTIAAAAPGVGVYELRTKTAGSSDRPPGGDEHESRRVVVRLAPGADAAALALARGWTLVELEGAYAIYETPEGREGREDEDADDVRGDDGVLHASREDFARLPEGSQANAPIVGSDLGRAVLDAQAALSAIRATAAHATATGDGVVVAVVDGGFDTAHEALAGRTLPGFDFVDGDADPADVLDGIDDDGDGAVDEGFGHGTFVASLVLAAAPDARVLPVRVLDSDGRGRSSAIAAGIEWAVDHGARVLNLSFGTLGGNATIASAVSYARANGVTVVAAAGNDGRPSVVEVPAALAGVVGVTSVDAAGRRAPFANAGAGSAIAAPGADLVGAFPAARYARWSGTSFSSALVAAGAALVLERRPGSPPSRVAALVARRARPFARAVRGAERRAMGAGVLDLERLVR